MKKRLENMNNTTLFYSFGVLFLLMCSVLNAQNNSDKLPVASVWEIPETLVNEVENGNAEVAYFIAQMYFEGTDSIEKNVEQAKQWLQKSAQMGHAHAMGELADAFHFDDDKKAALIWYTKAAELGLGQAFESIANYHMAGVAGLEKYCQIAYQWFEKAQLRSVRAAFNNHAWNLATHQDEMCRNPGKALKVYSQLEAIIASDNDRIPWGYWDTKAAILASLSDFSGAIKLQQWIINQMQSYDLDTSIFQPRLEQYQLRKPWIENH